MDRDEFFRTHANYRFRVGTHWHHRWCRDDAHAKALLARWARIFFRQHVARGEEVTLYRRPHDRIGVIRCVDAVRVPFPG